MTLPSCLVFYGYILSTREVQILADFVTILSHFVSFLLQILKPAEEIVHVVRLESVNMHFICAIVYQNVSKCETAYIITEKDLSDTLPDRLCTLQQGGFLIWKHSVYDLV